MKKILFSMVLAAFVIISFTGQSWAFGSRGHHGSSSGDNSGSGSNFPGDNGNNPGSGDPGNPGTNTPPNNNFPTAPVPEPMTLTLLGTGLAGVILKRKIDVSLKK